MKKKLSSVAGVTLIEILIGLLISVVMMAAMYTSYSVVNSTYSQVSDRAKISSAGRDVVGMMLRDIRNAGYKYFFLGLPPPVLTFISIFPRYHFSYTPEVPYLCVLL